MMNFVVLTNVGVTRVDCITYVNNKGRDKTDCVNLTSSMCYSLTIFLDTAEYTDKPRRSWLDRVDEIKACFILRLIYIYRDYNWKQYSCCLHVASIRHFKISSQFLAICVIRSKNIHK